MNAGALIEDRAEQIKWWDVLDALIGHSRARASTTEEALEKMRECQHPDALRLASLFPPGVDVTCERVAEVMREHGDDARVLFLAWVYRDDWEAPDLLERSASMGYAPAQGHLATWLEVHVGTDRDQFKWATLAAAQSDREGTYRLGACFLEGCGCASNKEKAVELFRRAAEWEQPDALWEYGELAFDGLDWERFYWWARAAARGVGCIGFWAPCGICVARLKVARMAVSCTL
jgi:TPR repeat protein